MTADLELAVERIAALHPYLLVSTESVAEDRAAAAPDPTLWLTPDMLAGATAIGRLADAYGARWGVAGDRTSQASFIVLDYSWYAFAPLVAGLVAGIGVPSLDGASVWLDPMTREGSLRLSAAADMRTATVDSLRAQIESHMAPIVEAIASRRWLGRRTAWGGIGDRVVGAFEFIGRELERLPEARAAAEQLVHHPGSMLDSPRHRFVEVEVAGRLEPVGLRATCCRFYRVPEVTHCVTCPLIPEVERNGRLREWLEGELAGSGPS